MNKSQLRIVILLVSVSLFAFSPMAPIASAVGPTVAVSSSVAKALLKYFGKEGAEEAAEYMAKKGGRELAERVASTAIREGGEQSVEEIAKYVSKYGPDALRAFDQSPAMGAVLKALAELPEAQAKTALSRLAAGTAGRELAEAVGKHGSKVLTSELKHPGVGLALVRALGDDGAELALKMTANQAETLAKHADDIAKLPATQRSGLLAMFKSDADKMVRFAGDFVKANPTKTLFTAAATYIVLDQPERILGGDEIVFDADGNPVVVTKKGMAGRAMEATGKAAKEVSDSYIRPVYYALAAFLGTFVVLWLAIKLWHAHKREQMKTARLQTESVTTVDAKSVTEKLPAE